MTLMGLVSNWSGLMAARWFLGLAEAGLFPGVNYYLSCWYRRSEFGIRAVSIIYHSFQFHSFFLYSNCLRKLFSILKFQSRFILT